MFQLHKIHEYEFLYGNRIATVYVLSNGIKIIGFIHGNHFDLRVLTVGNNPKRKGLGQKALELLRLKFKKISVNEIHEQALPFWIKMKERGLVDHLASVKEGNSLYLLNETASTEIPIGQLTIVNSIGIVNIKRSQVIIRTPETNESGENSSPNIQPPLDPDLEYVCAI